VKGSGRFARRFRVSWLNVNALGEHLVQKVFFLP
jgi:hypothetical protein